MNSSNIAINERLEVALSSAQEAGRLTLRYFQQAVDVERKKDNSPVTIADKEAENLLRERISQTFPEDGIVGEEFPDKAGKSGYRWIVDPIDGTKSFISGVPLYGTMVGVEYQNESIIGVVVIPGLDESIYAAKGQGAWYLKGNNKLQPAKVSSCRQLSEGTFVTTQIDSFTEREAEDAFLQLQQKAYITRTWGDCYGYLLVATGRATAMLDPIMNLWDAAAIQPIIEEAGGTFTDWQGKSTIHAGEGLGTNRHVLQEILEITRQFPKSS